MNRTSVCQYNKYIFTDFRLTLYVIWSLHKTNNAWHKYRKKYFLFSLVWGQITHLCTVQLSLSLYAVVCIGKLIILYYQLTGGNNIPLPAVYSNFATIFVQEISLSFPSQHICDNYHFNITFGSTITCCCVVVSVGVWDSVCVCVWYQD